VGQLDAARITAAPPDLLVIGHGAGQVLTPLGYWEFIVWSATFDPVPNDGARSDYEPIPLADLEYSI
jgi:hypothetical protein